MLGDKYRDEMANWTYSEPPTIPTMTFERLLDELGLAHQRAARSRDAGNADGYEFDLGYANKVRAEIERRHGEALVASEVRSAA